MRKILTSALLLLVASVGFASDGPKFEVAPGFRVASNPAPVASTPADSVDNSLWFACRVTVKHDGYVSGGSGTPVACENGKTLIMTNAHVVPSSDKAKPIEVHVCGRKFDAKYVDGSEVSTVSPMEIRVHGPDLCLLEIDATLGYVEIADDPPPLGAQVWQFGYGGTAFESGPTVKSGLVRKNAFVNPTLSSTLAPVSGDSGSGVFNTRGELVGVTWGGNAALSEHFAVEVETVRTFVRRPLAARLFPGVAARTATRRAARKIAEFDLPLPSLTPPAINRNGPVDPKLAKPPEGAQPKDPPKAAAPASPPVAPYGSGLPPKPAGEGWQYDPVKKVWWKWNTPQGFSAPRNVTPGVTTPSTCPNGKCPPASPLLVPTGQPGKFYIVPQ